MTEYRLPDGTVPVLLSADTEGLLRAEASALIGYLHDHPAIPPNRIAGMLFRTRIPRRYRALSMVTDRGELEAALRSVVDGRDHPAVARSDAAAAAHRLAFVLPGQGGQRPGMGALFYESVPAFRAEADRCDSVFGELFGESPLGYLLGEATSARTPRSYSPRCSCRWPRLARCGDRSASTPTPSSGTARAKSRAPTSRER